MCGLVGIFGEPTDANHRAFWNLMHFSVVRGRDSAGVFYQSLDNDWGYVKQIGAPSNLLEEEQIQEKMVKRKHQIRLMLGHTRAATIGAVTSGNAHPFKHGSIIMAHNGSLHNERPLYVKDERFETDSEHICYSLNHRGIRKTWEKIHGAAALSWYDMKTRRFNLSRNYQRTLFFAYLHNHSAILYASEEWMIEVAAERNKLRLADDKIQDIAVHTLHTFTYSHKKKKVSLNTEKLESAYTYQSGNSWGNPHYRLPFTGKQVQHPGNVVSLEEQAVYEIYKPTCTEKYWRGNNQCAFCGSSYVPYREAVFIDQETLACEKCIAGAKDYAELAAESVDVN